MGRNGKKRGRHTECACYYKKTGKSARLTNVLLPPFLPAKLLFVISVPVLWLFVGRALAEDGPSGIEKRVPWTSSRIKGTPDPPAPYRTTVAFPNLKLAEPLALTSAPGTDIAYLSSLK